MMTYPKRWQSSAAGLLQPAVVAPRATRSIRAVITAVIGIAQLSRPPSIGVDYGEKGMEEEVCMTYCRVILWELVSSVVAFVLSSPNLQ